MSGYKDVLKNGWNSKKDIHLRSSVKGMLGKGEQDTKAEHVAAPLSSLRDPASFAPPPKRTNTGPSAPPPRPGYQSRSPGASPTPEAAQYQSYTSQPSYHDQTYQRPQYGQPPQPEEPPAPPKPYRLDTTGLSTSNLAPPPIRRPGNTISTPSPPPAYTNAKPGPPPALPPRLPPRSNAASPAATSAYPSPPPPSARQSQQHSQGYLNQASVSRLGSAGISVPGLGIGSPAPSAAPSPAPQPTTETTWAQKRAALQTASDLHRNPSSVSASDAVSAASTFNNFHNRHGGQIASGVRTAGGVADRVGSFTGTDGDQNTAAGTEMRAGAGAALAAGKKKPPPPPPGKKPGLLAGRTGSASNQDSSEPPPVPLATRPRF